MPHADLVNHNAQFRKGIITLAPGIYTAVGYAASNVHVIEGLSGLTIVDTTESTRAAQNILTALRHITPKPVSRIIYTHSHRDHVSGCTVFRDSDQPVLACHLFSSDLVDVDPTVIAPNKALARRTQAQFGIGLSSDERINLGCGPGDRPMEGLGQGFVPPSEFIERDVDIDLDGVAARLIMASGETDDHMIVWLPESRVLIGGDNWYHAFPNLYAIRGTAYRDFQAWADTLGRMAAFMPEVLAPGHTLPVEGESSVQTVLLSTRDAILHVMKETAQGMNEGVPLDDIVSGLSLPDALSDKPWLKEFYGKLGWSARAFAAGTLGWYDGNPTHLGTLSSATRAQHIADLAGGVDALAKRAQATTDLQWRMELCDHLMALGYPAQSLKADTMQSLADTEINATARNTYLFESKKLRPAP